MSLALGMNDAAAQTRLALVVRHIVTACAYATLAGIGISLLPRRIIYSSTSAR